MAALVGTGESLRVQVFAHIPSFTLHTVAASLERRSQVVGVEAGSDVAGRCRGERIVAQQSKRRGIAGQQLLHQASEPQRLTAAEDTGRRDHHP